MTPREPLEGFLKDGYDEATVYGQLTGALGITGGKTVAELCIALTQTMKRVDELTAEVEQLRRQAHTHDPLLGMLSP